MISHMVSTWELLIFGSPHDESPAFSTPLHHVIQVQLLLCSFKFCPPGLEVAFHVTGHVCAWDDPLVSCYISQKTLYIQIVKAKLMVLTFTQTTRAQNQIVLLETMKERSLLLLVLWPSNESWSLLFPPVWSVSMCIDLSLIGRIVILF